MQISPFGGLSSPVFDKAAGEGEGGIGEGPRQGRIRIRNAFASFR